MENITFTVFGEPHGKDRPRITIVKGYAHAYNTEKTLNYENRVLGAYLDKLKELKQDDVMIFDKNDLIKVTINAYFSLNKGDYGKKGLNKSGKTKIERYYCPTHKDLDNIIKSILDALNGVCYDDDKQIVVINSTKAYTLDNARVDVELSKIDVN